MSKTEWSSFPEPLKCLLAETSSSFKGSSCPHLLAGFFSTLPASLPDSELPWASPLLKVHANITERQRSGAESRCIWGVHLVWLSYFTDQKTKTPQKSLAFPGSGRNRHVVSQTVCRCLAFAFYNFSLLILRILPGSALS